MRQSIRKQPGEAALLDTKGESDGGIQMRVGAAEKVSSEDSAHDGEAPSGGDHEPSGVLRLGALEQDCGHYSVAEQDHHKGAHKFAQHRGTQHAQLSPRV